MKILISAYACEPHQGSEPGVGWNVVQEVSKYHHVWVLTSKCHRLAIETELARNPQPQVNFIYLDPFDFQIDWNQSGKKTQNWVYIHYYFWQIKAYFVSLPLHQKIRFDILHHVTYVKYTSPCFLCFLPIPFIWGPVGGGELIPANFCSKLSLSAQIYEFIRNLARSIGEYDPFVRLTANKSILALATTEDTAARLRQIGAKNVQVYSQLGISPQALIKLGDCINRNSSPIRFLSVGRLIHWKGFNLGLAAFAQANLPNSEYWIIGEGCEQENLAHLTQQLGIGTQVKFCGNLSHSETLNQITNCHILIHPSLHDSGGLVCLEAMAAGLPVICLNLGGPAVQVTEETGFKITANTPEEVIQNMAQAMILLARDADLRLQMGQAGQKRVRDCFNWELKGSFLAQCYENIYTHQ